MPEDVRGRAQRLVELATHPSTNESEARNAAMAACKIIKEHGLLNGGRTERTVSFGGVREVRVERDVPFDMQSAIDELFGQVNRQRQPPPRPTRPPPEHKVEGDNTAKRRIPVDMFAREFMLASPAICIYCQEAIIPPKRVVVSQRRVFHPACYNEAIGR
jgi:hypothetical protein